MTPLANCLRWRHAEFRSLREGLRADTQRFLNKSPENQASGNTFKSRLSARLTPQLLCLVVYRLSHYLHANGWVRLAGALSRFNMVVHKLNLPADSCIGPGCLLPHPAGVTFYGSAGRGLTLYSLAICMPGLVPPFGVVQLGDEVSVGGHCSLAGALKVGHRTKISFNVPLRHDVPEGMIVTAPESWGSHRIRRIAVREVAV